MQINPEKYDNKVIKLITYVSSFYPDSEGEWKYSVLYVSEKNDISFNINSDWEIELSNIDFQIKPCMQCELSQCAIPTDAIKEGDKIVVIGEFEYHPKGEEIHVGEDKYWWQEGDYEVNTAYFYAKYIYKN